MKLVLAALSLLSVHADETSQLRGPISLTHDDHRNTIHLDPSTQLELTLQTMVGNDADDLAACSALQSATDCHSGSASCTWCESKAVSSACYPSGMTSRLPVGVFDCSSGANNAGDMKVTQERGEGDTTTPLKTAAEAVEEVEQKTPRSEFFNLKSGITLTLTSDAVDKEFCDPNSDVSLAGYMNVKGSQFDTNNDKHLFFWMFEKRTTSLLPAKSTPTSLKSQSGSSWPCFWNCDDNSNTNTNNTPQGSAAKNQDSSNSKTATIAAEDIPLVVWLTGGPGCSSSLALLTENGPCSVNQDGSSTTVNPHSWTESAHVLWLDQPADVGYSYGQDNDSNEEMISEDAYYFLQAFFQSEDGQKYKNNPLYIVGESYGGHYAPAIAHRIWRGNKDVKANLLTLNLAGLAVGNGLTNPEIQYQYYSEMAYKNSHNLQIIDESTYEGMKKAEPLCVKGIQECNAGEGMLNSFSCQAAFIGCNAALTSPFRMTGKNPYDITKDCGDNPLCYDFSHVEKFMNSADTKAKLHVDSHDPTWQTCNMGVNMQFHTDWMKDFSGYVADLLNDDIPALIYAGDIDFICNYLGNKAWVTELDWKNSEDFRKAEDHDWNNGAGLAKTAGKLTFLQVYDAGHMVPSDQPEHALTMITQFLNGEAF